MARGFRSTSSLSIGVILLIIVVSMIFIPMILSRLNMRAGFVDIGENINVPGAMAGERGRGGPFLPCRGVSGQPCPEGTFCDGSANSCTPIAVAGV
jgi:hypothetical protein